jgi:hypothetical protein
MRQPYSFTRNARDDSPMDHFQRQSALMRDRKINLALDIGTNKGHSR